MGKAIALDGPDEGTCILDWRAPKYRSRCFGLIIDFWKDGTATMAENERHESEDENSIVELSPIRYLCWLWRSLEMRTS